MAARSFAPLKLPMREKPWAWWTRNTTTSTASKPSSIFLDLDDMFNERTGRGQQRQATAILIVFAEVRRPAREFQLGAEAEASRLFPHGAGANRGSSNGQLRSRLSCEFHQAILLRKDNP